ncbi:MAG: PAS domain-containing protein, partial [Candidatus Brocadiales bacterium]|nr:PAS domain-containing protein [Candidatus Brocadiales bacterium]
MKKNTDQKLLVSNAENKAELQPTLLTSHGAIDKSIIDNLESDVVLLDKNFNIVHMNKTAEHTYGKKLDDVIGTSYLTLHFRSVEQNMAKNLDTVLKTGKELNIKELKLTSHENITHFFDQNCIFIIDKDGSIQGVLSISKDVTKRVNKEIQYQESKKMLEDLTRELDIKEDKIRRLQTTLGERYHFHNLIGKNYLMQNVYNLI